MKRHKPSVIGTQEPFAPWMKEGARVHNFGDVCNQPKNGAIVRVWADQWANSVEVRWDDGTTSVLDANAFRPGPLGSAPRCVRLHSYELRPDVQEHLEAIVAAHGITLEQAIAAAVVRMARGL